MAFVEFTEADLLRNKIVVPAWYRLHIDNADADWKLAKTGTSNNLEVEATIECNADNGETEFAGVPVIIRFNDSPKAKSIIESFLKVLGVETSVGRFNLAAATGKSIEAFVGNSTYEGRIRNEVQPKYRKAKEE